MKQLGQRYRVRQDPYFHGFWCIVDREKIMYWFNQLNVSQYIWRLSIVCYFSTEFRFRDADDALQMVKLLEISDKVNKGE